LGFVATTFIYVAVGFSMLMAVALHWRASAQRAQEQAPAGAG
jgi:hypothetical protein